MEIEIISKECIKPSSPTPHHLRNHKLSFLDLYIAPFYIPLVLYYPMNKNTNFSSKDIAYIVSIRLNVLKQSLSETLSRFYPFAGKIKDFLSIEYNDQGIYFVEALVESPLNDFLNHPDNASINKFLPDCGKWTTEPPSENYVAGVQVTTFACGGITIGVCVSHMIADGTAFSSFLKSWATTAHKNAEEAMQPKFNASSMFSRNDACSREVCMSTVFVSHIKFDKFLTRRFVFDASAIANLKSRAKSYGVQNPSRVQVVTALLGKCIMTTLKARSDSDKPFLLNHAVNLRQKATPPFSDTDVGNFVWMASASCKDKEVEFDGLVSQLREAITKVNEDFVSSLQGDGGFGNFVEAVKYERETCTLAADNIVFSSWCNFGLYSIDFGWGKPAWASIYCLDQLGYSCNHIVLMDTRLGNGIEAWVYLRERDMATLELDKELVEFASIDPNPSKEGDLGFPGPMNV